MMNEAGPSGETRGEHAAGPSNIDVSGAETTGNAASVPGAAPGKTLSPEAIRALEEAEARRRAAQPQDLPPEIGGRDGEEPTRYGDWEKKGLAVDF
jgi:hypothetical protein